MCDMKWPSSVFRAPQFYFRHCQIKDDPYSLCTAIQTLINKEEQTDNMKHRSSMNPNSDGEVNTSVYGTYVLYLRWRTLSSTTAG